MHNFDKTEWKSSVLKTKQKNLLRFKSPAKFSSLGQFFLKISFFKGKKLVFRQRINLSLNLKLVTEILKIKRRYLKIQIPIKQTFRFEFYVNPLP